MAMHDSFHADGLTADAHPMLNVFTTFIGEVQKEPLTSSRKVVLESLRLAFVGKMNACAQAVAKIDGLMDEFQGQDAGAAPPSTSTFALDQKHLVLELKIMLMHVDSQLNALGCRRSDMFERGLRFKAFAPFFEPHACDSANYIAYLNQQEESMRRLELELNLARQVRVKCEMTGDFSSADAECHHIAVLENHVLVLKNDYYHRLQTTRAVEGPVESKAFQDLVKERLCLMASLRRLQAGGVDIGNIA